MMKYDGPIPDGFKAFVIIYMAISHSLTNTLSGTKVVNEIATSFPAALLTDLSSLIIYTVFYIVLYLNLKNLFVHYFFKLYVSVNVITFMFTMIFTFYKLINEFLKIKDGTLDISAAASAEGYTTLPLIIIGVSLVLMLIPLIWVDKHKMETTETIS